MTVFVVLALVAAASAATIDQIDWSKVVPVQDLPQFYDKYPQLTRPDSPEGKIIGGEQARVGQFPHMVAILIHTTQGLGFCGGTILSNNYVITAAHCIDVYGAFNFTLIFGAHDLAANEPSNIIVTPEDWVMHADWTPSNSRNDIAFFKVAPILFNDRIQAIRLPSRSQQSNSFAGESATASGWGLLSRTSYESDTILRFVEQPIITNSLCNLTFGTVVDSSICMSGEGGRGPYSGDSGGPLTINENDGAPTQVGITSFGHVSESEAPVVFTRVTSYLDWIQTNTDVTLRP